MGRYNTKKILSIYIIMLPILDILSFGFRNYFNTVVSPSTLIRPLIPLAVFTYIFIKNKYKLKTIIIAIIYATYAVVHLYLFNKYNLAISYGTLTHELQYLVNYSFGILNLFIFLFVFNKDLNSDSVKKSILIANGIYILSLYISIFTNTATTTYIEGQGFKGWFESGNSLSAILVLNLFIIFTLFCKNENIHIKIISAIEIVFSGIFLTLLLGTRTGLLGLALVISLFIFAKVFEFVRNKIINRDFKFKHKILLAITIIGILLLLVLIIFKGSSYLARRRYLSNLNNELIDNSTGEIAHVTGDVLNFKEQIEKGLIDGAYADLNVQKSIIELYNIANKYKLSSTNRRIQQLIFNYCLVRNQANIFTIFFGNGFLNNYGELILEMEIPALLLNFGLIGFTIYFLPFFGFFIYYCSIAIKKIKEIDYEFVFLLSGDLLSFVLSFLIGQIYFNSSAMIIIICINVLLFNKCKILENKKENNKINKQEEKELISIGENI